MVAEGPLDARTIVDQPGQPTDPGANTFLADLTAAGGGYSGAALIGASPELLVARQGDRVVCAPFAGSAPRLPDPEADAASGAALAASAKNRHEHQLVVDAVREVLDPLCAELKIASEPKLNKTAAVWHLSTPDHAAGCAKNPPLHWIWRSPCIPRPRWAVYRPMPRPS